MATSTRALLISFFAVVGAFIGSTIWAQRLARGIDADTLFISRGAAPGIELLSNVRAEMRELETQVIRFTDGRGSERLVASTRGRLDSLLGQFRTLPADANAPALFEKMQTALRAFDEAAERTMEKARSGQHARETVEAELRPMGDAASEAIKALIAYDAGAVEAAARRIETERRRADRIAYELDAISALLAIAAAALVLLVIRHSHRVQEENRRIVERKAEELEQFAARVAHDILSPLAAVALALAVAERMSPQAREAVQRGSSSLLRVKRIVDGLLGFARAGARPEPGARTEVAPVVSGLREELEPFAADRGASLRIESAPDCAVACSSGVLLSLLGNLLRNAIKYLGDSQVREVALRMQRRRGRVLFEVEDTGPGVPPSLGARAFEPYVRGAHDGVPGIGLGLATVKRLVDAHAGTLGLRRSPRGGSIFWFELPESDMPERADTMAPHDARAPGSEGGAGAAP